MKNYKTILIYLILLLVAGFMRFYNVANWSLDVDETYTPIESQAVNWKTISDYVLLRNDLLAHNPTMSSGDAIRTSLYKIFPAYYMFNKQVMREFGTSEFSLRFLSVVFGVLSVPVLFFFCRKYLDSQTAFIASAITIFHPLIQYHSQNARFYSMTFFVFIVNLIVIMEIRDILLRDVLIRKDKLLLPLYGVFIWITMLIHANMIFSLVFLALVLYETQRVRKIEPAKLATFAIPFLIVGTLVSVNIYYFMKIRLSPNIANGNDVHVHNIIYNLESLIFNFGYVYCLIIPVALIVFLKYDNTIYRTLVKLLVISMATYFIMSWKSAEFRFDYIYNTLGLFIIIVSYSITRIFFVLTSDSNRYLNIAPYFVAGFLILMCAPSFLSNLIIDGDRLDWKRAFNVIRTDALANAGNGQIDIYTAFPGNFMYYAKRNDDLKWNVNVHLLNEIDFDRTHAIDKGNTYIVIPFRRAGLDIRGIASKRKEFIFESGRIVGFVGRSRLDVHIGRLVIFKIIR